MKNKIPFALQLAFNLSPIYGVFWQHWTIFSVIYIYWLETLITALFVSMKILMAQGGSSSSALPPMPVLGRFKSAFTFVVFQIFTLLFYMVFIVVFIGMMASDKSDMMVNFNVAFFGNLWFNMALMLFIFSQASEYIFNYIQNGKYIHAHPSDLVYFINPRTIVMHVVIVLGGVGSGFLKEKYPDMPQLSVYLYILTFILLKTGADIYLYYRQKSNSQFP